MVLDGEESAIRLLSLSLDGRALIEKEDYYIEPGKLVVKGSSLRMNMESSGGGVLRTTAEIIPEDNTQLSGLYKSGSMYCTQCEAMGFRRITYYPDRPDNMAIFDRVRIEANKSSYPILLSNGNLLESGDIDKDNNNDDDDETTKRHYSIWSDPYPKPSYLFALVAGNLGSISDSFVTSSGRKVHLEVYSERHNVNKLQYSMESLKRSMKWDEDKFGLEYDLDLYNIVAVDDFNMGAMENKGLNVFNTAYVLADPATATDADYANILGVIGHEYFHNWTGNRVTCRDWFQLTLKEGLTVFRDQEFSGEMGCKAVKRIETVRGLRGGQFAEDAGPMSHPIRPESYISMDNFYTATVYSKGAEVIRMYNTLLTEDGFRKGMDLYFARHDGDAVTCDDFRVAMADANDINLDQFGSWYNTAGTPTVKYASSYDSSSEIFRLTLSQENSSGKPLHIPVAVGLIDRTTGKDVIPTTVLELKEIEHTFEFPNINADVVPSILRGFSAPVKLVRDDGKDENLEDLSFIAANDTDGFNRWEAGQKLFTSLIFQVLKEEEKNSELIMEYVSETFERTLVDQNTDFAIKAYALTLPGESSLAEMMDVVDPVALHKARGEVKRAIARRFYDKINVQYEELTEMAANSNSFSVDATSVGKRTLRNTLLDLLCSLRDTPSEQRRVAELATKHYESASGMTDKIAALSALASMDGEGVTLRDKALLRFYVEAEGDALVLNKWFMVQALADLPDVLERVLTLTEHKDFTLSNPNRCRSLISAFTGNAAAFHAKGGEGYRFLTDIIIKVDKLNPQVSSRMAGSLIQWRKYDKERGDMMKDMLKNLSMLKLSDDLFEVVNRGLKS